MVRNRALIEHRKKKGNIPVTFNVAEDPNYIWEPGSNNALIRHRRKKGNVINFNTYQPSKSTYRGVNGNGALIARRAEKAIKAEKEAKEAKARKELKYKHFCSICQEVLEPGQMVTLLGCMHKYHQDCINEWFEYRSSCPECRRKNQGEVSFKF